MSTIRLPQVEGISPTDECIIIDRDYLLSMSYDIDRDGFIYYQARIGIDAQGDFILDTGTAGIVTNVRPGDEGITMAAIGALPDGYGDCAVIVSDKACQIGGGDATDIAAQLGMTANQLSDLIRKAWRIGGGNVDCRLWSLSVGIQDCNGHVIGIGSWVREGDGDALHRVVGVAINEFHGPMLMVDDAVTGRWFSLGARIQVATPSIATWEEFVDAASKNVLPKDELVTIAKKLAREVRTFPDGDAGTE